MKNDFNGHDNHHHDNLYGYIGGGMGVCGALPGHADQFFGNKIVLLGKGTYAHYDCKCNSTGTCPEVWRPRIRIGPTAHVGTNLRVFVGIFLGRRCTTTRSTCKRGSFRSPAGKRLHSVRRRVSTSARPHTTCRLMM